jgi:rhamnosyl/mannosyltransferase
MRLVDARLLIVGRGPLLSGLKQKAESCGVRERVTFLTDVEDVTPYYHAADVFALPSVARSEAFGIVQLEAMACAKPVVNTNLNSGVPSVSLDGISGLTVPPADSGALGRAINSLLNDPVRSTAYGRAGLRRVERHFSLEMMTSETLSLYREITRYVASNIKPSPLSALTIIKPDDLKSVPAASIPVSARRGTEVSA